MLHLIFSMGMIVAHQQPWCTNLDTLYIQLLLSRVTDRGETIPRMQDET